MDLVFCVAQHTPGRGKKIILIDLLKFLLLSVAFSSVGGKAIVGEITRTVPRILEHEDPMR